MIIFSHGIAFVLEIALLAALGRFGFVRVGGSAAGFTLASALILATVLLWGRFAAPKSPRRLHGTALFLFKTMMFTTGAGALALSNAPTLAAIFAIAALLHIALAIRLDIL